MIDTFFFIDIKLTMLRSSRMRNNRGSTDNIAPAGSIGVVHIIRVSIIRIETWQ